MKILVVEDHQRVNENICLFLKDKKIQTESVFDGTTALEKIFHNNYDLIILDSMLPCKSGTEICKTTRDLGINTPIIFLTALDSVEDKITGLDAGADDYLVKPFDLEELYARIRALLRRKEVFVKEVWKWGEWECDASSRKVFVQNKEVSLSVREFDVLIYLLRKSPAVISKEELLENVWGGGDSLMFSETVEVHVSYLRKKLGKEVIKTVRGAGYVIELS